MAFITDHLNAGIILLSLSYYHLNVMKAIYVIIIIDNFCIALFSGVPKLTALKLNLKCKLNKTCLPTYCLITISLL